MVIKHLIAGILSFATFNAVAQLAAPGKDTALKGATTIEVIQSYKPQVKQLPKPQWVPQLPPADTMHPVLRYEVPQQTLYYTYSSLPLRPLALGKDSSKQAFPDYIKAGYGNLSTIFVDAGIGGIRGKDYETAIHLHHISQKGSIEYQQSALSGIEADGFLHKARSDWHTQIIGERNAYNYYGFDHNQYTYPIDSVKQVYTTIGASVDMKNKEDGKSVVYYHPSAGITSYLAKFNSSELTAAFNAPFEIKIDSAVSANVAVFGALTSYSNNGSISNNYAVLQPGLTFNKQKWNGHMLLGLALGKESSFHLLPDLIFAVPFSAGKYIFSGGWQASLRQNTYQQLTAENPFLAPVYDVQQTRRDEIFVNLQGTQGEHLTYSGRISWWNFNSLPTFLSNFGDQREFSVQYEDLTAVSFRAAARYQVANLWSLGVAGDFYKFSGKTATKEYAWGIPDAKLKADFMLALTPKFMVTAYLALLDGIYAKDMNNNTVKQNIITDLGGNAEYQLIKRLSVFAQVDNLLSQKYQRWYLYPSYGLNVFGGLRVKF
jgi:hypothetical protein